MIFHRRFSVPALALAFALSTGCASIISDSQYPVTMTSLPSGATFEVLNEQGSVIHQGVTPSTVTLKAGDGYFSGAHYQVVFMKDGYTDQVAAITPQIDGWYVANIVFGGLLGLLIIDPATGAMYKLPEGSEVSLAPLATQRLEEHGLNVVTITQLTDLQQKELIKIN